MTYTMKTIKANVANAVLDTCEWLAVGTIPGMTFVSIRYKGKKVHVAQRNEGREWYQLVPQR